MIKKKITQVKIGNATFKFTSKGKNVSNNASSRGVVLKLPLGLSIKVSDQVYRQKSYSSYKVNNYSSYKPSSTKGYKINNYSSYKPSSTKEYDYDYDYGYKVNNYSSYKSSSSRSYKANTYSSYKPSSSKSYKTNNNSSYKISNKASSSWKDKVSTYVGKSVNQLIKGNYTDTILGTAMQIGTGIIGIDMPADLRDLSADIVNWEASWKHIGQTLVDIVGIIPVIGGIKYLDELGTVGKNAVKYIDKIDEIADTAKQISNGIKGSLKSFNEFSDAARSIGSRTDLTDIQKVKGLQELFKNSAYKIDINVPSDASLY